MKQLLNLILFIAICLVTYIVFRSPNRIEGLENNSKSNGIGGGSSDYVTQLSNLVTQQNDTLLIDKYRTDYENAIMKADDLINVLMLQHVLSLDTNNIQKNTFVFHNIASLSTAKDGLNKIMKFVDNSKSSGTSGFFS